MPKSKDKAIKEIEESLEKYHKKGNPYAIYNAAKNKKKKGRWKKTMPLLTGYGKKKKSKNDSLGINLGKDVIKPVIYGAVAIEFVKLLKKD